MRSILPLTLLATVAAAAPAAAADRVATQRGMHDARYCELFELRGTPRADALKATLRSQSNIDWKP